jgi:hypothetical protein
MTRLARMLLLAAPITLAAQEVVTLDQSLSLSYFGSRASLGGLSSSSSLSRADYRFDLGMPILAYRLGALDLGGSVGYFRQTMDSGADTSTGLNTISLQGALFPYQPYHVTFDVTRTMTPSLFTGGSETGQSVGLGLSYRGRTLQDFRLTYRHGTLNGAEVDGKFSSWTLTENERHGRTDIRFYGDHQEATFGENAQWRSSVASLTARTTFTGDWSWSNSANAFDYQGSQLAQVGSSLLGTLGPWTSMTFVDAAYAHSPASEERSGGFSQSLARTWGRFSAFAIGGLSGGSATGSASSTMENLTLGGSYRLSPQWTLMGDVSSAWNSDGASSDRQFTSSRGPTRSGHIGLSWGGEMPDILRHAMFYWSDLRFQKRIQEDYPPDYLPPELAKAQMRRRMDHQGAMQFSADAYQVENGGPGRQQWLRVQGGLSFNNGFMVQTIGDLRTDDRYGNPDLVFQDRNLTLHGAYSLGRTSLRFNYGYSRNSVHEVGSPTASELAYASGTSDHSSTYYAIGADSYAYGVPFGGMVLRNNDAMGISTTSLLAHLTAGFRSIRFAINYQRGWRSDGLRTSQVSIQLVRWFDTIPLWGMGN